MHESRKKLIVLGIVRLQQLHEKILPIILILTGPNSKICNDICTAYYAVNLSKGGVNVP